MPQLHIYILMYMLVRDKEFYTMYSRGTTICLFSLSIRITTWIYFHIHNRVQPLDERETPVTTGVYVRSGLLGFVGTGGLVFICGTMDGLIQIGARRHNTEDLIATVMAVEPHSFVYKGRYAQMLE